MQEQLIGLLSCMYGHDCCDRVHILPHTNVWQVGVSHFPSAMFIYVVYSHSPYQEPALSPGEGEALLLAQIRIHLSFLGVFGNKYRGFTLETILS